MKKKIVSLVLAGCLLGGGMGFTANAAEIEAAQPEESVEEVSETETSAEETVDVEIADEETPLAGPEAEVEVDEDDIPVEFDMETGDIELELEEVDENEKVDITPLEEIEKDGVEISDEEVPFAGEETEGETKTEQKVVSKLSTMYTQDANGTVHKITRAITVDENGNESVEETDEEYGYIGKDGGFYTIETKIEQDRICEINVEYVKDVQKIMPWDEDAATENYASFTITDEIVGVDLSYTTIASEDQEGPVTSEDTNIQAIFDKVNMPEKLDTGVDIVAHIDENGVVTEISATATEPIIRDREVLIAEAAEMDFEFDKEYVEEDVVMEVEVKVEADAETDEISIEDEETPLAGDMQDTDAEDEESEDAPEEVIKKVEATKEVAIVDELSDADADDEDSDADEAAADDAAEEVIDADGSAEEVTEVAVPEVSVEEISETTEESIEME